MSETEPCLPLGKEKASIPVCLACVQSAIRSLSPWRSSVTRTTRIEGRAGQRGRRAGVGSNAPQPGCPPRPCSSTNASGLGWRTLSIFPHPPCTKQPPSSSLLPFFFSHSLPPPLADPPSPPQSPESPQLGCSLLGGCTEFPSQDMLRLRWCGSLFHSN